MLGEGGGGGVIMMNSQEQTHTMQSTKIPTIPFNIPHHDHASTQSHPIRATQVDFCKQEWDYTP